MTQALDALTEGRLSGRQLLGLDPAQLDALVERALFAAEHGRADEARDLLSALCRVDAERPTLALLLGHVEAERGRRDAALRAYAEADRRLLASGAARPELAADIALARAEVELQLGEAAAARPRLRMVLDSGSPAAKARAAQMQEGLQA